MRIFGVIVLSLSLSFIPKGVSAQFDQKQATKQVDFYVSHLSDKQPELYYWGLLSIYNDSEYAKKIVNTNYQSSNNIYLYSLIHFSNDQDRFRYLYKRTYDKQYLLLSIYSSGDIKKLNKLQLKDSSFAESVVHILQNRESTYIPPHQLSILDAFLNSKIFKYSKNGVNLTSESNNFKKAVINTLKLQYLDYRNEFSKVLKVYSDTETNFLPISKLKIELYQLVSVAYYMKGYYYDAIELSKDKIIPLATFINDEYLLQKTYSNYGTYLFLIGDISQAQRYYKKAYNLAKTNSDYTNFDAIVSNLALTFSQMGELNKAINYQYEAYKYALKTNNREITPSIVKNLSFYYMNMEDWNDALKYLNVAYKLAFKSQSVENIIKSQLGLSYYYANHKKDFNKADSLIAVAYKNAKKSTDYKGIITSLADRAKLYESFEKNYKAIAIQEIIIKKSLERDDIRSYASAIVQKAALYSKIGHFAKADSILSNLSDSSLSTLEFTDLVRLENIRTKILVTQNHINSAKINLHNFINKIFTRAQNSIDRQSGHLMLTDEELETIHLLTDLYLKRDEKNKAIALMDRVKTLNKAAYLNSSVLKSSIFNEKELIRDRLLTKQIEQYRAQMASADSNQVVNIQNKLAEAISQKNELENRIINSQNEEPVSVGDIQNRLRGQDAVLYYTQFSDGIYASFITSDQVSIKKIPLSDSLKSVFEDVAHSLQGDHADLTGLYQIYHSLFDSMNVDSYKRLYIVPDGILYQVPFGILPTTPVPNKYSYGSAHYFIEKHNISYYTSLQELYQSWKPSHDKFKLEFAGFGIQKFSDRYSSLASNKVLGALPNTVKEVESIDSLLPGKSREKRIFIDANATESAFKQYAPEARILHLATHSEVFYNEPLFSVIYMDKKIIQNASYNENDLQDDGQIHAYELFPLHLKSDMVMLSSCESGTGSYITGSGLIGLNRAFTYAGVKSLVMNMWKVDDKAAETVSVQFYKYLKQGMSKDEALRQAKLYYLNNINSDPLKWGSYIVAGKITPLFHPTWDMMAIASRLLIVFIAVVAGYAAYKFNP